MNYKTRVPHSAKVDIDNTDAARVSAENTSRIEILEQNMARLSLLSEALWHMLQDKTGLEDAELHQQVELVINQRKLRSEQKLSCMQCGLLTVAIKTSCMYCGGKLTGEISKPLFPA
jgi:hypothetical protein